MMKQELSVQMKIHWEVEWCLPTDSDGSIWEDSVEQCCVELAEKYEGKGKVATDNSYVENGPEEAWKQVELCEWVMEHGYPNAWGLRYQLNWDGMSSCWKTCCQVTMIGKWFSGSRMGGQSVDL